MPTAPLSIILFEPEIPPNTGNIARLCAATGTPLHLVEPLGFSVDDKHLKRAGLDYWPHVDVTVWPDLTACLEGTRFTRLVPTSARRGVSYHTFAFRPGDALVFGPETRGLPPEILDTHPSSVRIPIRDVVRSLNLSTSAGILLFEARRQLGLLDAAP